MPKATPRDTTPPVTTSAAPPTRRLALAALASAAAMTPLAVLAASGGAPEAHTGAGNHLHPDADLIQACEEHMRLDAAICAYPNDIQGDEPIYLAYLGSMDAIKASQPSTMAGLVAKAHTAKYLDRTSSGGDEPTGMAATVAWTIVNDVLRLAGGRVA